MSVKHQISALLLTCVFLVFVVHPELWTSAAVLLCAIVLYGFVMFLEQTKANSSKLVQDQIKDLKNRIDGIYLGKGLGR